MVAALTRIFGVHNLALAEDVVQDAFCRALEVWKVRGIPENPSAWLMATAKNRALDVVRRERTARTFAPELGRLLETRVDDRPIVDEAFAAHAIRDEQLRMMFSCCHPRLPEEAQVALDSQHPVRLWRQRDRQRVPQRARGDREADLAREEGARAARSGCSISRTPSSRRGSRPFGARCTCCSTRAITARPARPRCASSCAPRRCA